MAFALVVSVGVNTNSVKVSAAISTTSTSALAKIQGYTNPLITQKFGVDPFAIVYNSKVYVYINSDAFMYSNRKLKC